MTARLEPAARHRFRLDLPALGLAITAIALLTWGLMADNIPAWPSTSCGLVAVYFARYPGHAFVKALSTFLAVVAIFGGLGQIVIIWALALS